MLQQQDKKDLNQMQADLKMFEGKVIKMQVENGEGPVFDDLINQIRDTMSSIRRITNKITFK